MFSEYQLPWLPAPADTASPWLQRLPPAPPGLPELFRVFPSTVATALPATEARLDAQLGQCELAGGMLDGESSCVKHVSFMQEPQGQLAIGCIQTEANQLSGPAASKQALLESQLEKGNSSAEEDSLRRKEL